MGINTKTAPRERGNSLAYGLTSLLVAVAAAWPSSTVAEVRFSSKVAAAVTYTDNIEQTSPEAEQDETLLQVKPGFEVDVDSQRLTSHLEYRLDGYISASENDRNAVFHQLELDAITPLISDLFFLEGSGRIGQGVIDPSQHIPTSRLIPNDNITDIGSWSLTPILRKRLFGDVESELSYEYGQVRYLDQDPSGRPLDDLDSETAIVELKRAAERSAVGWSAIYKHREFTYTGSAPLQYALAQAEISYRVTPNFSLLARGGAETDLSVDQTSGSLDASFWQGGFRWAPSLTHTLSVYAGKRYYDDAYEAEYEYTGRILKGGLTYIEQPSTQALDFSLGPVFVQQPGQLDPGLTPITRDLYLGKTGRAWLTVTGRRNEIVIDFYREQRIYLSLDQQETELAGSVGWRYRLGPRTTAVLNGEVTEISYRGADRDDALVSWSVGLQRMLGPRTTADLTFSHYQRDTNVDDPGLPLLFYRENAITLGAQFTLR